jgi:hypothetical protein
VPIASGDVSGDEHHEAIACAYGDEPCKVSVAKSGNVLRTVSEHSGGDEWTGADEIRRGNEVWLVREELLGNVVIFASEK